MDIILKASIPNMTLILSVAAGVGLFLVVAFLRMLLGIALPKLLVVFYGLIFVLAAFVPKEFLSVAFDSGGVTTGPITVPFIMALGVGVAVGGNIVTDAFGVVAMVAMPPPHHGAAHGSDGPAQAAPELAAAPSSTQRAPAWRVPPTLWGWSWSMRRSWCSSCPAPP